MTPLFHSDFSTQIIAQPCRANQKAKCEVVRTLFRSMSDRFDGDIERELHETLRRNRLKRARAQFFATLYDDEELEEINRGRGRHSRLRRSLLPDSFLDARLDLPNPLGGTRIGVEVLLLAAGSAIFEELIRQNTRFGNKSVEAFVTKCCDAISNTKNRFSNMSRIKARCRSSSRC